MGDFVRRLPQFTLEMFHAFRDERPKEEKWELIDGVPMMMPPPTLVHQRIGRNLESMLNEHLRLTNPEWQADREIGVLLADDEKYNPEPDVTVIDAEIGIDQVFAKRFYFVAEVLSKSDEPALLAAKLNYYQEHGACHGVLFVRQDRIEATLYARSSRFVPQTLQEATARMDLPAIGDIGPLAAPYRHTPFWRPEFESLPRD